MDELRNLDIPVTIHYVQVARVINWSLIIIIILILLVLYSFFRGKKQEAHVHDLEHEVDHLEHEIAVLERAKKSIPAKKIKKVAEASVEIKPKTTRKKKETLEKSESTEVEKPKTTRKPRAKKTDTPPAAE
jgi:biopolymer transport protein ExbB/TolQ